MKAFACGDVVPGCQARWVASTDDDILAGVATHARDVHGVVEVPEDLVTQVRSLISTTH